LEKKFVAKKVNIYGLSFVIQEILEIKNIEDDWISNMVKDMQKEDPKERLDVTKAIKLFEEQVFFGISNKKYDELETIARELIFSKKLLDFGDVLKMDYISQQLHKKKSIFPWK